MPIKGFFDLLDAAEIEDLRIGFETPIERQTYFPGLRKYFRILDRRFIADRVRSHGRVALRNVQRIAMKISRPVEPGVRRKVRDVDNQRISVPTANRVSHVG